MSAPRFQHDCDACRFLGQVEAGARWGPGGEEGETFTYDVWYCARDAEWGGGTLIARHSDEGGDYLASDVKSLRAHHVDGGFYAMRGTAEERVFIGDYPLDRALALLGSTP